MWIAYHEHFENIIVCSDKLKIKRYKVCLFPTTAEVNGDGLEPVN